MIFNTSNTTINIDSSSGNNGGGEMPSYALTTDQLKADWECKIQTADAQQFKDLSGNNNHGFLGSSNSNTSDDPLAFNYADTGLSFPGLTRYCTMPLIALGQDITMEVAFFPRVHSDSDFFTLSQDGQVISLKLDTNGSGRIQPVIYYFKQSTVSNPEISLEEILYSSESFEPKQWHYLQISFSSNAKCTIYRNLFPIAIDYEVIMQEPLNAGLTEGLLGSMNNEFYGVIAICRLYDKVLTNEERKNNFLYTQQLLANKGIII